MPSLQNSLLDLGFSPAEAEIYLKLAENKELDVKTITQKTGLSRTAVHEALNELLARDLLEYEKKGRNAIYSLGHPNKLFGLIEEKRLESKRQEEEWTETVKTLTGSFNLSHNKPGVRFFEGKEGIREITFDSLKAKDEILTYLDVEATQAFIKEMNKEYVAKRVELGIKKRMIVPDTPATRERYRNYRPLIEIRLLPPHVKPFETSVQIYNDSISFSTLDEKEMIGFLIEDKKIVQLHKTIFEFVWESLPPLTYK